MKTHEVVSKGNHEAGISKKGESNEGIEYLKEPRTGRLLRFELAENIALVSPALRKESIKKLVTHFSHKIDVHYSAFRFPNPSAIIPINDRYFGRFSWDEERIVCHELFEIPEDTHIELWKDWSKMQSIYVQAYSSPHRQPGNEATKDSMIFLAECIKRITALSKKIINMTSEVSHKGTEVLITKIVGIIENIDYDNHSKSPTNAIVQLELALSTAHDIIKRLMPRVINI